MRITIFLCTLFALAVQTSTAQSTITIDYKTQRFINEVSTLDRTKYIHAYLTIRGNDPKFTALKEEYNFHPDYIGGRGLSNPASNLKSNTMPSVKNTYSGVRKVDEWYVTGGRPSDLFWDGNVDYSNTNTDTYSQNLANYVAKSLKSEWDNLGKYCWLMN